MGKLITAREAAKIINYKSSVGVYRLVKLGHLTSPKKNNGFVASEVIAYRDKIILKKTIYAEGKQIANLNRTTPQKINSLYKCSKCGELKKRVFQIQMCKQCLELRFAKLRVVVNEVRA